MRQNAADLTRIYSLLKDRIPLKLKKCYVKNTTSKFSTLYSPPPSPPPPSHLYFTGASYQDEANKPINVRSFVPIILKNEFTKTINCNQ